MAPAATGTCPSHLWSSRFSALFMQVISSAAFAAVLKFYLRQSICSAFFHLFVFSVQSSGIFSSEQLLSEILSRCSNSINLSATHCEVSLASGSWSQHSVMVSHTSWIPWGKIKRLCCKHKCFSFTVHSLKLIYK